MAKIDVIHGDDVDLEEGYAVAGCRFEGGARSRRVSPDDNPLWLVSARVEPGSRLAWESPHGDEAVFVKSGSLTVAGERCDAGGVLVVEAGAQVEVDFTGASEVVHVGQVAPDARPDVTGGAFHLVGPDGVSARRDGPHLSRIFADAKCPTCTLSLHWSSHDEKYHSSLHSHSQDELIHVLRGDILLGRRRVGPGDTLAVRAHTRYSFESGDAGYGFLNYSPAASAHIRADAPATGRAAP